MSAHAVRRRPYQTEALTIAQEHYERGITRMLLEMATGTGKTGGVATQLPLFFPTLFERNGDDGGLVFFVHRREIVLDTARTFRAMYPDRWVGIEMGEEHATGMEDIIVVSVDSLGRFMSNRLSRYRHRKPGIIIFDEAHHLTENGTWDNVATFMGVGSDPSSRYRLRNGDLPLSVLLTATPDRHDRRPLSPFVDPLGKMRDGTEIYQPVFKYDYRQAVKDGWLCDIVAYHMEAHGAEAPVDVLLRAIRDYGKGHKTLVFAGSVADSAELAATLCRKGISSASHVDALTEGDQRREAFDAFRNGRLAVLSNFAVFTEGTDLPDTTLIVDGAETASRPGFAQKVGRGSRTSRDARVDDYETAAERHAAIAASSKPYSTYIATFPPTKHSLTVYSVLTGDPRQIHQDGVPVIGEIVDSIELFETEKPAVPVRDIRSLDDIEVVLREANVWTRTVYNERLHAMSPLTWTALGDQLAIHVPSNPWAKSPAEQVPVVVAFEPVRENGRIVRWIKTTTLAGGWNSAIRRPVKKKLVKTETVQNVQRAVAAVDAEIKSKRPRDHARLVRRPHDAPDAEQVRYLDNAGIKYEPAGLTAATAGLLITEHRCRRVLASD